MKNMNKAILFASAVFLSGCATTNGSNADDPLEGFNRAMFEFNDGLDRVALKPAATAYQEVLPSFVQTGVNNFFGNIGDVWTMVNNFLQGKVEHGLSDVMRVTFNSTIGLGGLLDIASEAGIPKHKEDFGQTLGKWGVGSGPYVVLPLFGPSTVRDTAALPVDIYGDLWTYTTPVDVRNVGAVVRVIDQRATALNATNLLEDIALDRYTFIRGAYLQRRQNQVNDGAESTKPEADKVVGPQSDAAPLLPASDTVVAVDAAVEPQALETVENLANEPVALM
ncbi:MlaA family lipoprotein [Herminiimonas fonticola]|uniref:Phospholipid-binding lipoprotein MlaA n=1 Tax=Herminiimonas fonticola TaxID=303380 RepID=A0A4R6GGE2_9BURK|nr:VacJ family lipoprotein [Herminiimonas fonticola]RBA24885.1 Surface lipoprotein [Herminiimonas fonticola]TDN93999.1 phospholipid-binding lipoprotein MlaA [Herminiimonas fonticola]